MSTLNEEYFSEKKPGLSESVRTFDAFPKTRETYRIASPRGGVLTLFLGFLCLYLTYHEFFSYLSGTETQSFTVESAVGHSMQINLDITVAMPCDTLQMNVQDAALDRILAGDVLTKDSTSFDDTSAHRLVPMGDRPDHVYAVLARAKKSQFGKTKRKPLNFLRKHDESSCRIYGSMEVNRVQGDFHITAAGHGYAHAGQHIDHGKFNFSHVVNELSFGELYPKLVNPLDDVTATTKENFYRFQYYLSIVPTMYRSQNTGRSVLTNQYAVTEQGRNVNQFNVPGIFFKYDIEPLRVTVNEERTKFTLFAMRVVNIIGGVLVGGNWMYKLAALFADFFLKKKRDMDGVLHGGEKHV